MKKVFYTLGIILILIPTPAFSQGFEIGYSRYMEEEALKGQIIDTSGIDSINCDSFVNKLNRTQIKIGFTSSVLVDPKAIISVKSSEWNILLQKDSIYFEFKSDTANIELKEGNLFKKNGHWWYYTTKTNNDWAIAQISALRQELLG